MSLRDVQISVGIAIDHAATALAYAQQADEKEAAKALKRLEKALAELRSARESADAALSDSV